MKPQETVNQTYGARFDQMCASAENFWQLNTIPGDGGGIIYVDLLAQDVRVAIRVLTLAASIQRHTPAKMVALVGPDPYWRDMIWSYYDAERMSQIARAYGAVDVIDVNDLVDRSIAGETSISVAGEAVTIGATHGCEPRRYEEIAEATHMRALRIPLVTDEVKASDEYLALEERNEHYARVYEALMGLETEAFITSHIDYHQWGYAVDAAMRHEVPVHHVQSTGSFKSYALFPEMVDHSMTARMNWTLQIADFFERYIWPARGVLSRAAETVAFRAKMNYGRPSWWRGGGSISELGFRSEAERASVREHAMKSLGFDPAKPVVAVYNHAISDAVHSNHEIFDNLADWFTSTVEFAATQTDANWLFLDHPAQSHYDGTMMFEEIAERFADHEHMAFWQSMDLTKNVLWSLVDVAITVRGSVSNEFPAYGVPAIQAGWSEWSHIGISKRADSQDEYWSLITDAIERLTAGERIIDDEQIERARLWLWFYRAGTDVASGFVPHWESSQADRLYLAVSLALTQVESDGDAGLVAVRRMLSKREPFLTRVDFHNPIAELADALGVVGALDSELPIDEPTSPTPAAKDVASEFGMTTIFDEPVEALPLPADIRSGADPSLVVFDGVTRGVAVFARCSWRKSLLGLKVEPFDQDMRVTMKITLDKVTHQWWGRKHEDLAREESHRVRHIVIRAHGDVVGGFTITGEEASLTHSFVLPGGLVRSGGLLMLELTAFDDHAFAGPVNVEPLQGLQIDSLSIEAADGTVGGTQSYIVDHRDEGADTAQGSVVPGDEPARLRFSITEKPALPGTAKSAAGKLLLRGSRKVGFVRRRALRSSGKASRDAADVGAAFFVDAYRPGGERVEVPVALVDDGILEATFPADAGLLFFELGYRAPALERVGYSDAVEFQRV